MTDGLRTPAEEKAELRRRYRALRASLDFRYRDSASRDICRAVLASDVYRQASLLLLYYSCGSEPDLTPLASAALADGKAVAYPVTRDDMELEFYSVPAQDARFFSPGKLNIPEPTKNSETLVSFAADTLCILPALCADADGFRLGQGGGCYDRFLARFPGVPAVCVFHSCLSAAPLPRSPHDMRCELIFTEKETVHPI